MCYNNLTISSSPASDCGSFLLISNKSHPLMGNKEAEEECFIVRLANKSHPLMGNKETEEECFIVRLANKSHPFRVMKKLKWNVCCRNS